MIENNDNKPKKESELDITELLRRYMPEEYAEETDTSDVADSSADLLENVNVDGETVESDEKGDAETIAAPVKENRSERPRRRMTARRQIETDTEESVPQKTDDVIDEESAAELETIAEAEPAVATSDVDDNDVNVGVASVEMPEDVDVKSDEAPAEQAETDETADLEVLEAFEALEAFEKQNNEPKARSFDPDVDIFSEFEEPRDELYDYIDEAFAESEVEATDANEVTAENIIVKADTVDNVIEENDAGTMVFDSVAGMSAAEETEKADDEFFAIDAEGDSDGEKMDDFDLNIMLALGMEEELEETIGIEKVSEYVEKQQGDIEKVATLNRERAALDYEYTSKTQVREVIGAYQTAYRNSKIKIVYAAVLSILLLFFECHASFGITLTGAFDPTLYPVVYIMVGFQLLVLIAAPAAKSLYSGLCDFFRGKPAPESLAAFALILETIYTAVISFVTDFGETGLVTFNFPVAVGFLLMYLYELINLRREIYSFSIVSSKKPKYALQSLSMAESHLEHDAFSDMMEEDDDAEDIGVLKVECADFVNDYFLRTNRYPSGRKFIGFLVPAAIIIAAAFFAYKYNDSGALYGGMKAALTSALICLPASIFYMFSHPFYIATEKAHEEESTIIGEGSAEEYADAAIISFDDKNVFPSTNVNVRAINVFGNNRIDRVLYYAASTFCTVGGPLSDVFDIATRDIGYSSNVKLLRALPGLLETEVDGSVIAFGTIDALESAGIAIPKPLEAHREDVFEPTVSVMYMTKDGKFISRMLISYIVDSDFEFILKQLDRGGMFIGMKTFDPNITEQFLGAQVKLSDYPIRVIRCKSLDDRTNVTETTNSGLISKDSPKSVLQTVSLCEKVLHARSINTMILIISLFVGLLVSALSILFGALTLSPLFIALYSIFWIIPMLVVSKIII